jgi:hypothetical protein
MLPHDCFPFGPRLPWANLKRMPRTPEMAGQMAAWARHRLSVVGPWLAPDQRASLERIIRLGDALADSRRRRPRDSEGRN